ncbi:hypothetical protein [Phenylobacterium sp.]|uniref:hypothetical protein n=1 Tax=Phenylobacterium sp. TaxID=1871053 RepID=UPI002ED996A6
MAKGPKHEPEVTDLARYRKAKAEEAKRKPPKPPKPPRQSFLGSNPRAGLILAVVVVVLLALWLGPRFL